MSVDAEDLLDDLLAGPVEPNDSFKRGVRYAFDYELLPAALFGVRAGVNVHASDDAPPPALAFAAQMLELLRDDPGVTRVRVLSPLTDDPHPPSRSGRRLR